MARGVRGSIDCRAGGRGRTLTKVMDVVVPSMSSRRAEARLGAATGAIAGRGASGAEACAQKRATEPTAAASLPARAARSTPRALLNCAPPVK